MLLGKLNIGNYTIKWFSKSLSFQEKLFSLNQNFWYVLQKLNTTPTICSYFAGVVAPQRSTLSGGVSCVKLLWKVSRTKWDRRGKWEDKAKKPESNLQHKDRKENSFQCHNACALFPDKYSIHCETTVDMVLQTSNESWKYKRLLEEVSCNSEMDGFELCFISQGYIQNCTLNMNRKSAKKDSMFSFLPIQPPWSPIIPTHPRIYCR